MDCTGILNKEKDAESRSAGFLVDGLCFVRPMILAVLMSSFFLVPTVLALAGGRSKGQNTSLTTLFVPQITVERFAYSIYGIGLTTLVITVLITGLSVPESI